jgi:hypothetical protein
MQGGADTGGRESDGMQGSVDTGGRESDGMQGSVDTGGRESDGMQGSVDTGGPKETGREKEGTHARQLNNNEAQGAAGATNGGRGSGSAGATRVVAAASVRGGVRGGAAHRQVTCDQCLRRRQSLVCTGLRPWCKRHACLSASAHRGF